ADTQRPPAVRRGKGVTEDPGGSRDDLQGYAVGEYLLAAEFRCVEEGVQFRVDDVPIPGLAQGNEGSFQSLVVFGQEVDHAGRRQEGDSRDEAHVTRAPLAYVEG